MNKRLVLTGVLGLLVVAISYGFISGNISLLTNDQRGYYYYQAGLYEDASRHFTDSMWRGAALFRGGKFEEAAGVFSGYDTPQAAFNHGNSLVMLGKYTEAVERYERALQLKPNWEAAENNREIARGRAQMLKKEGGEMTGGKLGADEIVFSKTKSNREEGENEVVEGQQMSDMELRTMWLRNVQTKPADFLRAKFSYQVAMQESFAGMQTEQPKSTENGKK